MSCSPTYRTTWTGIMHPMDDWLTCHSCCDAVSWPCMMAWQWQEASQGWRESDRRCLPALDSQADIYTTSWVMLTLWTAVLTNQGHLQFIHTPAEDVNEDMGYNGRPPYFTNSKHRHVANRWKGCRASRESHIIIRLTVTTLQTPTVSSTTERWCSRWVSTL